MKKLILLGLMLVLSSYIVSGACSQSGISGNHSVDEEVTVLIACTPADKNDVGYYAWYNSSGDLLENDTFTVPSSTPYDAIESWTVTSAQAPQENMQGNLTVNNAFISGALFNISETGGAMDLDIVDVMLSDNIYEGLRFGVTGYIKNQGELVGNAEVCIDILDDKGVPILHLDCIYSENDGHFFVSGRCTDDWCFGAHDYLVDIDASCHHNSSGGTFEKCHQFDGDEIGGAGGTVTEALSVSEWVTWREDPFPIVYSNGSLNEVPVVYAGFDRIYWKRNATNNYGEAIKTTVCTYLVDNATGRIYGDVSEGSTAIPERTFGMGNESIIFNHLISQDAPTGIYKIRLIFEIFYKGENVAEYIVDTDTFNVTSIQDIMTINTITIKDYWGSEVNTSATTLSGDSMPDSNWTNPHTVLTEGFGYQICGNITNAYTDDIYWHMENLIIHNPITGWTTEEFHSDGDKWQRILKSGENNICWYSNMPLAIPTHSDYHFDFDVHIGTEHEAFACGSACEYGGETEYFYIGAIEDSIIFDKWHTEPTGAAEGIPLTFIVTEREEYLSMNDDCNYTTQLTTEWGNGSFLCNPRDGGSQIILNLSVYPRAGENFKVCWLTQNYLSDEVDLEFYDVYIDSDKGETVIAFDGDITEGYIPSIQDDKLWVGETPSRALELGGNLIDGYGIMCSKWMMLPFDVQGGNNWDIQGKVRVNPAIYDLDKPIVWNWESDEFPIFGTREGEFFTRLIDITNVTTSAFGKNVTACTDINVTFTYDYLAYDEVDFIGQYCFEQTDTDKIERCYERLIDSDVGVGKTITDTFRLPYFANAGEAEVEIAIFHIEDRSIKLGVGDIEPYNTFNVTVDLSDDCKYSENLDQEIQWFQAGYLKGINSSAGTLDFSILAADTSGSTTIVKGSGRTGQGQVMNRDVRITCQVEGYPFTANSFTVFATDTFSFEMEVEVPSRQSTYTMSCTAKDVKFGTFYSEAATDNFRKIFILQGGAGGQVSKIEGDSLLDRLKKEFLEATRNEWLIILGIVIVGIFLLYRDKFGKEEFEI